MASTVSICNLALSHLGADKIDALSEASTEARACNRLYAQTLDTLLASGYPWRFTRYQVALSELAGADPGPWSYAYAMPSDVLRILTIVPSSPTYSGAIVPGDLWQPAGRGESYELSGEKLYCNLSPASLRYIRRIDDPAKFPPLFIEALSWHLAARLAMPLTRDANQRQAAFQMAVRTQAAAAAADANDEENSSSFASDYERIRE